MPLAAGSTLSLYPGGTRLAVLRLLAVFLLFAVVRNTYTSKESLRRLCLACLVNGSALALLALMQFLTAHRHVVYWIIPTGGTVFGPFINRNDYAFYVNLCSTVLALFCWRAAARLGRKDTADLPWNAPLQHAPSLWLGVFLCLLLTSLAFCLSRGGLAALAIGCMTAVTVHWANRLAYTWQEPKPGRS